MRRKKVGHVKMIVGNLTVSVNGEVTLDAGGFHVDTPILEGETLEQALARGINQGKARPKPRPDDHEGTDTVL